jgi:hypothetical protein
MSYVLSTNIPLMALALALWVGIPLWLVLRRSDWHGKPEARTVPAYMASRAAPTRPAMARLARPVDFDDRLARVS